MTSKPILINGKKVRCRELETGEVIKKGDVLPSGELATNRPVIGWIGHKESGYGDIFHRPLPAKKARAAKPKKAKPGSVKAVRAWGDPSKVGKFIRFEMTLDSPPNFRPSWRWQEYRISPISTKGRGKK